MVLQGFPNADVRFGDVIDLESLKSSAFKDPVDVAVSCMASRSGGKVQQLNNSKGGIFLSWEC